MALTYKSSIEINSLNNQLNGDLNNLESSLSSIRQALYSNTNYHVFAAETDIGQELNQKLQTLLNLIGDLSDNQLKTILSLTTNYTEIQNEINERGSY